MSFAKRNFLQRAGKTNRHHMVNKMNGGRATEDNMLVMDERRHAAWHLLFKNMDFLQVIELLKRCYRMKTQKEVTMTKMMRLCIICMEKNGTEYLSDALVGCVRPIEENEVVMLTECAEIFHVGSQTFVRRTCKRGELVCEKYSTCIDRAFISKQTKFTSCYCDKHRG